MLRSLRIVDLTLNNYSPLITKNQPWIKLIFPPDSLKVICTIQRLFIIKIFTLISSTILLYKTKGITSSERKVTNQKIDDFCLDELET